MPVWEGESLAHEQHRCRPGMELAWGNQGLTGSQAGGRVCLRECSMYRSGFRNGLCHYLSKWPIRVTLNLVCRTSSRQNYEANASVSPQPPSPFLLPPGAHLLLSPQSLGLFSAFCQQSQSSIASEIKNTAWGPTGLGSTCRFCLLPAVGLPLDKSCTSMSHNFLTF